MVFFHIQFLKGCVTKFMHKIKVQNAHQYQLTAQNKVVWMGKIDEWLCTSCRILKTEYGK